jgi:hypothetical protein
MVVNDEMVVCLHNISEENFDMLLHDSGNSFPSYLESRYNAYEIKHVRGWRQFKFRDKELYTEFILRYG